MISHFKAVIVMKGYNVLVTSIGGDLGKAVCKALQISQYNINIVGTDCKHYEPYPLFCDEFHVIPRADAPDYLHFIRRYTDMHTIDLIYICSEQELFYMREHFDTINDSLRAKIVMHPAPIIDLCRDKLKTTAFLKEKSLPYAPAARYDATQPIDRQLENFTLPLIVKKTVGCGSKNVYVINKIEDFNDIRDLDPSYMLQTYIYGTEYTNAVYCDYLTRNLHVMTLERVLKDGMSYETKVVFDTQIEGLCKEIAKKLDIRGSINIQLRKQDGHAPVVFEINPRYSSTSFIRARFGFNDVLFAFENLVLNKPIAEPEIITGSAYRYITEFYKFDEAK